MSQPFKTHDVTNQAPPLAGSNLLGSDPVLAALLDKLPAAIIEQVGGLGAFYGSAEAQEMARLANASPPLLRTHDSHGVRIDVAEHHAAYHALVRRAVAAGLHCSIWDASGPEARVRTTARAARFYCAAQVDVGHLAAATATNSGIAALAHNGRLAEQWLPMLRSRKYDQTPRPAMQKAGALLTVATSEKQAGTDLAQLATLAEKVEGGDGEWRLTGHKWFVAAPMADAFVTLAQTKAGLTTFLVPRHLPDGSRNAIRFMRLKDKLGTRSTATAEIEFEGAGAFILGEPGEGIDTIHEVVTLARLDDSLAAAALMRAALSEAVHHCRHRMVGGKALIDQPLMTRVLADLALDVTAATALAFRLAESYDRAGEDPAEAAFARLITPVAKYWIGKVAPAVIAEAMEAIGGNMTVEEARLPRLYRDAPVVAIGDGPGNVLSLEVLRLMTKSSDALDAVLALSEAVIGSTGKAALDAIRPTAAVAIADEGSGRLLTEQLALAVAAATLHRSFPAEIGDAFVETRLDKSWRSTYGMLDARFDARGLLDFICPAV